MTTEKMTVHKALCELKTLDARIQKSIQQGTFVFANKHSNNKVAGVSIGTYSEEIRAAYQSAKDLIARRDAIKRAVTLSNATVKVTIGGKEYTVAEAIEMKNHGMPPHHPKNKKRIKGEYIMIKVTVGNNVKREAVIIDENTTLRSCLEANGVDYTRGVMHLDGSSLNPGDLDKTFQQFGITEKCFLLNVVKADNA